MHRVLERFADLQDGNWVYNAGDTFPRTGAVVSAERLAELSGSKNRRKRPMIEEIKDDADGAVPRTEELVRQGPAKVVHENGNKKRRSP